MVLNENIFGSRAYEFMAPLFFVVEILLVSRVVLSLEYIPADGHVSVSCAKKLNDVAASGLAVAVAFQWFAQYTSLYWYMVSPQNAQQAQFDTWWFVERSEVMSVKQVFVGFSWFAVVLVVSVCVQASTVSAGYRVLPEDQYGVFGARICSGRARGPFDTEAEEKRREAHHARAKQNGEWRHKLQTRCLAIVVGCAAEAAFGEVGPCCHP
jgi:hypothetical protein